MMQAFRYAELVTVTLRLILTRAPLSVSRTVASHVVSRLGAAAGVNAPLLMGLDSRSPSKAEVSTHIFVPVAVTTQPASLAESVCVYVREDRYLLY